MASSVFLFNTAAGGSSKTFLQAPSFHSNDSAFEDFTSNTCEMISKASHFENSNKSNPKLTISHLGLSIQEFDLLSTTAIPTSGNVWTSDRKATPVKSPHFGSQSLNDCRSQLLNVSVQTDSVCGDLSASKREDEVKSDVAVTPSVLMSLMNNQESLLVLDCRTFLAFNANHINGALNVSCSDRITRKRLVDGKIKVVDLVSGQEAKEMYRRLEANAEIVLYDESSVEIDSLPETNSLRLVARCLLKHGKHSKFLQGGLQAFQDCYSFMCSHPDSGAGVPLLYSPTSPEINCEIDTAVASEILPYLFIGNQRDASNRERLDELGVTHILNVTSHLPLSFENEGIIYKRLPATDSGSQNLKQYFSEAISFIDCAREANGKVLVHCQAGVSRSPTIVAAYLIATLYKSLTDVFTIIKDRRPIVAPNINFMGQLLEFEQRSVPRSGLCPPSEPVHLL